MQPPVLRVIDQTMLPNEEVYRELRDLQSVWTAIKRLVVRGAPAIGVAAAYGIAIEAQRLAREGHHQPLLALYSAATFLKTSRPTAVNLAWGVDRVVAAAERSQVETAVELADVVEQEAMAIHREDIAVCRKLGELGADLIPDDATVLTHCNAGALATSAWGTALAGVFVAHERGKKVRVMADETRPLLQGARLTCWELMKAGIPTTLLCDNMAASAMARGGIAAVFVGADRVAANGDAANKIGTYGLALAAQAHGIPFYVVAPWSTIDLNTPTGAEIPIEQRDAEEVTDRWYERRVAPPGVAVYNPAFDVTPAKLIAAIVTERGVIRAPFDKGLAGLRG